MKTRASTQKKQKQAKRTRTKKAPAKTRVPAKAKASKSTVTAAQRIEQLAEVFRTLGARDPEKWARAHVERGTDELGRFVFLRALWLRMIEPGRLLGAARRDTSVGMAIDRIVKWVDLADLDALVRFAQRAAIDDVCKVLDGAAAEDGIRWSLFRTDDGGQPLWSLGKLQPAVDDAAPR